MIPLGAALSLESELAYHLSISEETPSNNTIRGMHYHDYKTLRKKWQWAVFAALNGKRPKVPLQQSAITILRYSPSYLDWDNALGGLKPLLDCLVMPSKRNPDGLGLIQDDSPIFMPNPPFLQQLKCKRGEGKTELIIYKLNQ